MRRVVVTGLGIVAPTGNTVNDAWNSAIEGISGVDFIKHFNTDALSVKVAACVKNFSPEGVLEPKELRRSTRFVMFGAAAAKQAAEDAGILSTDANTDTWGTVVGVGLGAIDAIEENTMKLNERGPKSVSPFFLPYSIPNMAAGVVSRELNLRGPNLCTTTACTSGTHAVGEAFLYISQNMADLMVAGGAEAAISPLGLSSFASMKALSTEAENPQVASRPFDANRNGFVMGEGAGIMVLEELEHAKKRGAKIYAELVGYGMSADAHHITAPSPGGEGASRCMQLALKSARLNREDIAYINAHGTSTKLNDAYETMAISTTFGDHAKNISISSTKGVTGHCLGAAGGIEAVYTALAVHQGVMPPTANLESQDPECNLDYIPEGAREKQIPYALSNSFGFGGTNGTIVFKRFSG